MHPYDVLVRPVLSEKSNATRERVGHYTFKVRLEASKKDIKTAVEKMFDVKVDNITTMVTRDKQRRRSTQVSGRPSRSKKAIVKLTGDAKIKLFEDL